MAARATYLKSNLRLRYDCLFGCRARGLILYGTLPSSLVALGLLEVSSLEANLAELLVPALLISIVPLSILYLLVRHRLTAWYLLADGLWVRSISLTSTIVIISSTISCASGLMTGKYVLVSWREWMELDTSLRWTPVVESVLLAIVTSVGSSTLVMTVIKQVGGLPALPSEEFVKDIRSMRDKLLLIQNDVVWHTQETEISQECLGEMRGIAGRLSHHSLQASGRRKFYEQLAEDLSAFDHTLRIIATTPIKWQDFFSPSDPSGSLNPQECKLRLAVQRLREIRVNA